MAVPLVLIGILGAVHKPSEDSLSRSIKEAKEVKTEGLPSLPRWAGASLPDFKKFTDTKAKKQAFFDFLYPRIVLANSRILLERQRLEDMQAKPALTESDQRWLARQAERLRVEEEPGSPAMFEQLKRKLDVIPPSLVLAQAANESAWGTSRFATRGNNLFGQWCFSKGCGIVPKGRAEGATHEVADFSSPYQSVRSYIQNLNRHYSYEGLRQIRQQSRNRGGMATGFELAAGLLSYSERGEEYVEEIRDMMRFNKLGEYDTDFRNATQRDLEALRSLASAPKEAELLPQAATVLNTQG